jgi:altronate dehydratase small subunit
MKPALVISARDNVATALQPLHPGQRVDINGSVVIVAEPIARGHKIALRPIPAGDSVIKYGSAIGTASADIVAGAHVHTHNVASSRGRGDLDVQVQGEARLAEPSDDGAVPPSREATADHRSLGEGGRGAENGSAAAPSSISSESRS